MIAGLLALVIAALFTGAAFYISFAEHPARMKLPPKDALVQWEPSYERGYTMQGGLAVAGTIAGLTAWWMAGASLWIAGALLMIANWPWTLFIIMPVNARLKERPGSDDEITALLNRWLTLHNVRIALGLGATICFALALLT